MSSIYSISYSRLTFSYTNLNILFIYIYRNIYLLLEYLLHYYVYYIYSNIFIYSIKLFKIKHLTILYTMAQ